MNDRTMTGVNDEVNYKKKNVEIVARSTYDPAIGLNAIILISFNLI